MVQNFTKEYINSTSFVASEDRTRFDFLVAYFLGQSKDLIDNFKAIYLYERYTQLDLDSFIENYKLEVNKEISYLKFSGGKIELLLADAKSKKEGQPLF